LNSSTTNKINNAPYRQVKTAKTNTQSSILMLKHTSIPISVKKINFSYEFLQSTAHFSTHCNSGSNTDTLNHLGKSSSANRQKKQSALTGKCYSWWIPYFLVPILRLVSHSDWCLQPRTKNKKSDSTVTVTKQVEAFCINAAEHWNTSQHETGLWSWWCFLRVMTTKCLSILQYCVVTLYSVHGNRSHSPNTKNWTIIATKIWKLISKAYVYCR
jgi:hypothetical protein